MENDLLSAQILTNVFLKVLSMKTWIVRKRMIKHPGAKRQVAKKVGNVIMGSALKRNVSVTIVLTA